VRLEHLRDGGEPLGDRVVPAGLADLQRDERGDRVAERGRIHLGPVSGDHAALGHPVQARLHGAAGHAQTARGLEHAHLRLGGEQSDERGVQGIDRPVITGGHAVQGYHGSFGINSQVDQWIDT